MTHAVLLESNLSLAERHSIFGRLEIVGKSAHDLHAHEYPTSVFGVGKLQGGYVRNLKTWRGLTPGIGGTISGSAVSPELASRYSGRVAVGLGVFFTVRP